MALKVYKTKRNFKESPEPTGGKPDTEKFRFVIQKHAASHLHYDFRLEMEGVLKSWAVPKGPSMDPSVKRLAMMVEDHPYDYRNFEGIIPSGYGAGTVMVWDEGYYEYVEPSKDKKTQDKLLRQQLHAGKIHFVLHGKKLKGEFGLIKVKGRGENSWLLFKVKDDFVSTEDILKKDKSVISKKTLTQIAKSSENIYKSQPAEKGSKTPAKTKAASKKVPAKKAPTKKTAAATKKLAIKKPIRSTKETTAAGAKKKNRSRKKN